jgi:hypothetical protein
LRDALFICTFQHEGSSLHEAVNVPAGCQQRDYSAEEIQKHFYKPRHD